MSDSHPEGGGPAKGAGVSGAVLAGGESRRFGSDKARYEIGKVPLWKRQLGILAAAGASPVFFVRRPGQWTPPGVECLRDRHANVGPIAGLQVALAASPGIFVAVLAVDMPNVDPAWFLWLKEHCRPGTGAMVRHAEACEPLAAIYPIEALGPVERCLEEREYSLQKLARSLAAAGLLRILPVPDGDIPRLHSLNTPPQER